MSQKRIQDYGSPVTASSLKNLTSSLVTSAVLSGNDFLVDAPDRLKINPGSSVTHQGVIIKEDEPKYLNIVNTSNPVDYTVYYNHEDADVSGGVAAILTLATGLLTESTVEGVILGYIRYPGSGVPLAQSHFIQAPKVGVEEEVHTKINSDWLVPIKSFGYMQTNNSGTLNITDTFDISGPKPEMYVKIRNNTGLSASTTLVFPFKVKESPYALLQLVVGAEINALVTPIIIDSNGTSTVLSSAISNSPSILLRSISISRDTVQTPNTLVYLQLQMVIASNREVNLQALGLNQYNLPV
jgi:hypothetical protein